MRLPELALQALGIGDPLPRVRVTGVSQDHRKVKPGHVFVARVGAKFDGHRYVRIAIERGAVAVVGIHAAGPLLPWERTPYLRVEDDRQALARLAATFHGHPSRSMRMVGVTGTDGKTTVSFLLHHLLSGSRRTGLISTAAVRLGREALPLDGHFTTPEAPEVQSYLAAFRRGGCSDVVLESSSHALAMHRLGEVEYDVGVWTNLTPEHLDYHGTLDEYLEAKALLIRRAPVSILNRDDPHFERFRAAAQSSVSYGIESSADWHARQVRETPAGIEFELVHDGQSYPVFLPMPGSFNVYNALAALAAAQASGLELTSLLPRLGDFPGVPGRMQMIASDPYRVVVDFAHTAPALQKALQALRPTVTGRILLVIGAAGERDPGKRQPLGAAAARGADLLFFTEEDHRSESLDLILDALRLGALEGGADDVRISLIADRREAIRAALSQARPGDLVLLAGKGHESSLERSHETIPWDEAAEAARLLAELHG